MLPRFSLNCSLVLPGLSTSAQLARALESGYEAVEFWWPFTKEAPAHAEVNRFVRTLRESELAVAQLNFFGGGPDSGGKGMTSLPGYEERFASAALRALEVGRRLGVTRYNAMYGVAPAGTSAVQQVDIAVANLRRIAPAFADEGAVIGLEPLSGVRHYRLRSGEDVMPIVDELRRDGVTNVGIIADLYHLTANGSQVEDFLRSRADQITHIQIADLPGRGAPGSGTLPLARWVSSAYAAGYRGWTGVEYIRSRPDEPIPGPHELALGAT